VTAASNAIAQQADKQTNLPVDDRQMSPHRPRKGRQQRDPFGPGGFGDDWNFKPTMRTRIARASDECLLPIETNIDTTDWGTAFTRRKAEEAKRKKEREEWSSLRIRKRREVEAKMKAVAKAKAETKAKAEAEANEVAVKIWHHTVKQATDCIAHADPAKALNILYSLSLNGKVTKHINPKEKREVNQLYEALYNHFDLQKFLPSYFVRSSSEIEESIGDESTIGGDTIKVNRSHTKGEKEGVETEGIIEIGSTVVVVDRFPTHPTRETDESSSCGSGSSGESTIGGGTVKCPSSRR